MSATVLLSEEDVQAGLDAVRSGWLTMGPRIQALETAFAARMGTAHAVAVSSGAAGLHLACCAAGVRDGVSAVVSALAPAATVGAPRHAGGTPLPAEPEATTAPAMSVRTAVAAADECTRVVVGSHLAGRAADTAALRAACDERDWVLVEDATQALGATLADGRPAGTAGRLGVYGFAPGHVVGVGEGGMVVTDDDALAQTVRHLRSHAMTSVTWDRHRGHAESYDIVAFGFNFRMDEPRAALAASQLERLDALVEARRALARAATRAAGLPWDAGRDAPQAIALVLEDGDRRDALAAELARHGVPVDTWPDGWSGAPSPPGAADARARTVLIDLGAVQSARIDAIALGGAVARAVRRV
jgi:dTDP-4-amino-4,6-dideoxygalactose transaminase